MSADEKSKEKPVKDDVRAGQAEAVREKQQPIEPFDEESLERVMRDCPL